MKKFSILLLSLLLCCSNWVIAQEPTEEINNALEFLQGNGIYESGVMFFLKEMKLSIWEHFSLFINEAKALAAIFMIIFFAIKSYEMMSGDKKLEVMPLLRPFGLAMVIMWWGAYVKVIAFPTDMVALQTEEMFMSEQNQINKLRMERADLILKLNNSLYSVQSEAEVAQKEAETWYDSAWNTVTSPVKTQFSHVFGSITELKNRLSIGLQLLATQVIELLAIWLLRIAVYIIFIIQIIYSSILIILGPFAVAASILPSFRDSLSTWVARFISVNLYSGIAYLVMYIMALMQKFALSSEIVRYKELVGESGAVPDLQKIAFFAGNGILSFGTVIVAFIIGAICMFTVPSISTWIISTSGISSAASSFGRGSVTIVNVAKKAGGFF